MSLEGGREGGTGGGEGGWGRAGWREGGRGGRLGEGRDGWREGWRDPMPSEIGTRISLTRYLLISCIFIKVHHHHFIS